MATAQPKSVPEMILTWSETKPDWQRDGLRRITSGGEVTAADVVELVQLCKKGQGAEGIDLVARPLTRAHLPAALAPGASIAITAIKDVKNVNRLSAGQELSFAPTGITVVYGDNGVGKSGYSRILKRACRARFPGEILPNAFEPLAAAGASAVITYRAGTTDGVPIQWTDEESPHPILSGVSVFDRESGQVHVKDKNEVAFRPFGLDIPDGLAAACLAVKEALVAEETTLKGAQDPAFSAPTFSPATKVGKILGSLTAKSDLASLNPLMEMSPEETARLDRLRTDLSRDPATAAAEQKRQASALTRMANEIAAITARVSDDKLGGLIALRSTAKTLRDAAKLAADEAFKGSALPGVGEEAWRALWEAARRYSIEAAYPELPFPQTADQSACVLCHQTLDEAARDRLAGFDAFVRNDTEQAAQLAEERFAKAREELAEGRVSIPVPGLRQQLVTTHPVIARQVLEVLAAARVRRAMTLAGSDLDGLPALSPSPSAALLSLASEAQTYADELAQTGESEGRRALEDERNELLDRAALADLIPKAEKEVERLKALNLLKSCIVETATNAITSLGNTIADEVITPRVRDRFQEEIQKLAATRVRVDIVRSGGKYGSPQYQVRLFANDKAKVAQVLSEGEQTCVALAAFLTELATSAHGSALVFDDPVSSLDHRWRRKVAERLIEEAGVRQIIVFTHDLIFLNDLHALAQERTVPHNAFSLIQSAEGAGVVTTDLPWIAARVPERVDLLEKEARAAKLLYDAHDDTGYEAAVAKIYSRLRSTWERGLEDVALGGVVTRHRDYINTKDLVKVTVLQTQDVLDFQAAFKKCCDQTDAHDPSRGRNAAPPPPDELLADIAKVRPWVDAIRQRQKAVA